MSLIHWWPLDGNLKDKITGQQLQNYNAYVTEEGKIGSAYSFDYESMSYLSQPFINRPSASNISIALWLKWNSDGDAYWEDIFTIGEYYQNAWNAMPIVICIDTNGILYASMANGTDSLGIDGPSYLLNMGEWYHVAVTINNYTITLYINGEKVSQVETYFNADFENGYEFLIGGNGSEVGNYTINDVRVYDHELSLAEIKELAKALMIHYSFNNKLDETMLYNETGFAQPNKTKNIVISSENDIYDRCVALQCNGDTVIETPSNGDDNVASASFWIYIPEGQYPIENSVVFADGGSTLAFGFYGTQDAIISCNTSRYIVSNIKSQIKLNKWNHIAIIKEGYATDHQCYVNGEKSTLSTTRSFWHQGTTVCMIGQRSYTTNNPFTGFINDFRLYHSKLTETEIKELYNCGGRISNLGDVFSGEFIEDVNNMLSEQAFKDGLIGTPQTDGGDGTMELHNGALAYGLKANLFYDAALSSNNYRSILYDQFKENTQYYFDLWLDVDDLWYADGGYMVPGGLKATYTDGTATQLELTAETSDRNNPQGWQHVTYLSLPGKTIKGLGIYYFIGTKWFLRTDSCLTEYIPNNIHINKTHTINATTFTEQNVNKTQFHGSSTIYSRQIIET